MILRYQALLAFGDSTVNSFLEKHTKTVGRICERFRAQLHEHFSKNIVKLFKTENLKCLIARLLTLSRAKIVFAMRHRLCK